MNIGYPSLTRALWFFSETFNSGRDALSGQTMGLVQTFITFEVVFAGLYLAFGSSADFKAVARKILTIGFFMWITSNYKWIITEVMEGFILAGQTATGRSSVTFASLQDPDLIFFRGLGICNPILDKVFEDWNSSFIPSSDSIFLLLVVTIAVIGFGIISIQVFTTYLEYLVITAIGAILIPFGIFKPTAFLAERLFGAIVAFGVKLMVLAVIIGLTDKYLETLSIPATASWRDGFSLIVISFGLCYLSIHAPSLAMGLLSGSPQLSLGSIVSTAAASAAVTSSAISGGKTLGSATKSGAGLVATGAGSLMGGAAGDLAETRGSSKSALGRAVSATAAGVSAPILSTVSAMKDRVMWGEGGSPNGQARYRASIGDESLRKNEGLIGKFNTGKYSSPRYRQKDVKERASANQTQGGSKKESQNGSQKNDSSNQQQSTEGPQKGSV